MASIRYTKENAKKIMDMGRQGLSITEICNRMKMSRPTFYNWCKKPKFLSQWEEVQDELRDLFIHEAESSLLKKINGYTVEEKQTTIINSGKDKSTGKSSPMVKEQTIREKHIPADTAAIIFTLTNKAPEKWQNKHYNELTGKDGQELIKPARVLTKKEAKELLDELENGL